MNLNSNTSHSKYILRCLELARKGIGKVSPNPFVGCVIVKNGKVIAEGYHKGFGAPHAEVDAFQNAANSVKGADLYVNLEPCSHHGKTPPCADRIIEMGIKRVFIGTQDPNTLVAGNGIKKLKAAGISVESGIEIEKCNELNRFFFKHITTALPYVSLKIAQTLDGYISTTKNDSKWITGEESRKQVHMMRASYDAVLIGRNTALMDNPELTVRMVKGRNPKRIVLDTNLSLPINLKLFTNNSDRNTILVTTAEKFINSKNKIASLTKLNVEVLKVTTNSDGKINLKNLLKKLYKINIGSVLVEGGAGIYSSFLKADLADEIISFVAPKIIGQGISPFQGLSINKISDASSWGLHSINKYENDVMLTLRK